VQFALDEARMILPGVQALFGFQLIAVFNQRFDDLLGTPERAIFLVALVLITAACALVMAPAAYHRQVERGQVSGHLLVFTSGAGASFADDCHHMRRLLGRVDCHESHGDQHYDRRALPVRLRTALVCHSPGSEVALDTQISVKPNHDVGGLWPQGCFEV
jgi:hypothetical protein